MDWFAVFAAGAAVGGGTWALIESAAAAARTSRATRADIQARRLRPYIGRNGEKL